MVDLVEFSPDHKGGIMCDDGPRWLSPAQIATALGVGESSVKRWIDAGKIAAEKSPGGHRRVSIGQFDRFVQEYDRQIINPDVIGLNQMLDADDTSTMIGVCDEAIGSGDVGQLRQVLRSGQHSGRSLAHLMDTVVYPAYRNLRRRCDHPSLECPVLHRAIETIRSALTQTAERRDGGSLDVARVTLLDCGYEVDGIPTFLAEHAVSDTVSVTQLGLSVPEVVIAGLEKLDIWQHLWISAHGPMDKKRQQYLRSIIESLSAGQNRSVHVFTDIAGLKDILNVSYPENFSEFRAILRSV